MKYNFRTYSKIFVWLLPISFLLSSCKSDFKSVEDFVQTHTSTIKSSSDVLAQDIYDSCVRRANYINLISDNGIEIRDETLKECNSINKPNVNNVQTANDVILEYMTSLGQVASGKTVTFDTNITALKTALQGLKIGNFKLPSSSITDGTNIVSILVNSLTKSKRGQALKKAILCSDDSFHRYITGNPASDKDEPASGGLIKLAQDGYISDSGILGIEKQQIDGYYKTYFPALERTNGTQIAGELEAQKDYIKAMEIIQQKSDNAELYINILRDTAGAHHKLRNEFLGTGKNAISQEELHEVCQSVLSGKVSDLEKSGQSQKLNLTKQQLDRAKVILAKYAQDVEDLRKKTK